MFPFLVVKLILMHNQILKVFSFIFHFLLFAYPSYSKGYNNALFISNSNFKALRKFVADGILQMILLFFREQDLTFHVNHLADNSPEILSCSMKNKKKIFQSVIICCRL